MVWRFRTPLTFGGIGFFNKEDSTRKGGTVQVRTSERCLSLDNRRSLPTHTPSIYGVTFWGDNVGRERCVCDARIPFPCACSSR